MSASLVSKDFICWLQILNPSSLLILSEKKVPKPYNVSIKSLYKRIGDMIFVYIQFKENSEGQIWNKISINSY